MERHMTNRRLAQPPDSDGFLPEQSISKNRLYWKNMEKGGAIKIQGIVEPRLPGGRGRNKQPCPLLTSSSSTQILDVGHKGQFVFIIGLDRILRKHSFLGYPSPGTATLNANWIPKRSFPLSGRPFPLSRSRMTRVDAQWQRPNPDPFK